MPTPVVFNGSAYNIPLAGELNWSSLSNFLIDVANNAGVTNITKQAIRVATTSPVTVSAATDYTVVTNLTVPGPVTVNLPAGVLKQAFVIVDGAGDAGTNNITINGSGGQLINGVTPYVINRDRGAVWIQFNGTSWNVLAAFQTPGQITNADVAANAAITRTKLASGTADYVVINDGTGVMSEEQRLAKVRGGSGQDNTALTFPATGTIATLADIATATQLTTDLITTNNTVTIGTTYTHNHFVLDTPNTITVDLGATYVSIGPDVINGTMVVNGLYRSV